MSVYFRHQFVSNRLSVKNQSSGIGGKWALRLSGARESQRHRSANKSEEDAGEFRSLPPPPPSPSAASLSSASAFHFISVSR
jgi:hypothetical protein